MHAEAKTKIKNRNGFHVRPSTTFSILASEFESDIKVSKKNGATVDGKILMMLMTLNAPFDTKVTVSADGPDAEEAVKALIEHIDSSFGGIE